MVKQEIEQPSARTPNSSGTGKQNATVPKVDLVLALHVVNRDACFVTAAAAAGP
jgi:hypothetical protein